MHCPPNQGMRILLTNAFGLLSKFDEFRHALKLYQPDIAIVTETKFTLEKLSLAESSIPGYGEPMRADNTAQGGGVAVWCKSCLAAARLDLPSPTSLGPTDAVMWCQVRKQEGNNIILGALYRSGSSGESDTTLLEHVNNCLNSLSPTADTVLAGNFNVHNADWLGSSKTTRAGEYLEDLSAAHGLVQHVDQPTRQNNPLDLILSILSGQVCVQTC